MAYRGLTEEDVHALWDMLKKLNVSLDETKAYKVDMLLMPKDKPQGTGVRWMELPS